MYLIDTHTHIYLPEFDDDREIMINRAREAGVRSFYLPAIDSSTHNKMLEVEAGFDGCHAMMGLHPCSVTPDYSKEIDMIKGYLDQRKFIAIGEIGLDFHWDKTFVQQQYEAFHLQCRLAIEYHLPVVIHSRNAVDECIEIITQYAGIRGVFHCFSGDVRQAKKIMDLGFMLGIGGVLTFKNSGLDKVMEDVGIDAVILETDAPYLAPVPFRGKRNEPAYTRLVADKLAAISGRSVEQITELTSRNAGNLFKL